MSWCWWPGREEREALRRIETTLNRLEEKMGTVLEGLQSLRVDLELVKERILADRAQAKRRIAELEAQIAAGEATPEILAELESLRELAKALDPTDPTTLPPA